MTHGQAVMVVYPSHPHTPVVGTATAASTNNTTPVAPTAEAISYLYTLVRQAVLAQNTTLLTQSTQQNIHSWNEISRRQEMAEAPLKQERLRQ